MSERVLTSVYRADHGYACNAEVFFTLHDDGSITIRCKPEREGISPFRLFIPNSLCLGVDGVALGVYGTVAMDTGR